MSPAAAGADRRERRLPGYSRVLHEPAPDRIRIGPEARWVFVEGNFLFLDVPPWREIRELFDRKVYLDAEDEVLAARLARRHAAAGRDAEWIQEHFRRTDGPNIRLIRTSARFADVALPLGTVRKVARSEKRPAESRNAEREEGPMKRIVDRRARSALGLSPSRARRK